MGDNKPSLPDRLAAKPRRPHYVAECFQNEMDIRVNGKAVTIGWIDAADMDRPQ